MIRSLKPYPAFMVGRDPKTLVIADLHVGWEIALSKKGIHVPTQTPKLLERLKTLLSIHKVEKLVVLGDVKHTVASAEMNEWRDVPEFFSAIEGCVEKIQVIRGNHDGNLEPLLPQGIEILAASGIIECGVGLFHGHKWPSPSLLKCKTLIMGHVHPIIALRDPMGFRIMKQVWVKMKIDSVRLAETLLKRRGTKIEGGNFKKTLSKRYGIVPKTQDLLIVPSFNDFLGGRPLNRREHDKSASTRRAAGPVLRSEAADVDNAEIYLLDGTFLGSLGQLRSFI